ncbi:MAG: hypothetical protein LBT12_06845 [Oscillospiraceae bacterium]|jgi:hypothetical protein|nr:hypothetical protein [Oscillospiraceae bacterium]
MKLPEAPRVADALSHAYIVYGGGRPSARSDALAAAAVCSGDAPRPCGACPHCAKSARGIHPDIIVTRRLEDKREILVDQARAVREDAVVSPNEAERKVYVIEDAGTMNGNAQNALLKLLEEPPGRVMLILLAESPRALLPTVRSRCVELYELAEDAPVPAEVSDAVGKLFAAAERGALALTELSFELEKLAKPEFALFIEAAKARAVSRLRGVASGAGGALGAAYLSRAVRALDRAAEYVNQNVSASHAAAMLCAALIEREMGKII